MSREEILLTIRRVKNRLELTKNLDNTLSEEGPLSFLYNFCKSENEADLIALFEESRTVTMEGLILRLVFVMEKTFREEYAKLEEEIRERETDIEQLRIRLRQAQDENAKKNAQLYFVRTHISQIIEDFQSLIKNPDKLLSALKIVCDIVENGLGEPKKPRGYHYNIEVIKIAILTIVHARCSFRSAVGVLGIFQKYLPYFFPDGAPAYTTVRYWVIKSGLALMPMLKKRISGKYILIVDESIVLNKQKMLVVLAVPLRRNKGKAISFREVSIAHMEVSDSWTGKEIADRLKKVADEIGSTPQYVLSDDGTNIIPAVRELGWNRHRDIGHAIATMLKDIYEEEDRFVEFKKTLGSLKNLTLSDAAPFAPPKERSWARWLNISPSVAWAVWILEVHGMMDENVAKKFEQLCSKHPGIVKELKLVIDCVNDILKLMKTQGLSHDSISKSKQMLEELPRHYRGTILINEKITAYLDEESALLKDENDCHPISSDIIESYFSIVKGIMPNAKYYGFTEYSLGMYTRVFVNSLDDLDHIDILEMMNATSMKDIDLWCEKHLVESAYDRKKAFMKEVEEGKKTETSRKAKKTETSRKDKKTETSRKAKKTKRVRSPKKSKISA